MRAQREKLALGKLGGAEASGGSLVAERAQLTAELEAASTLAAVSAVEQVPGLGDDELQHLEDAMREERARR